MKIVFMGIPDFAAGILLAMLDAGEEVIAVVSQPDRPVGRKAELCLTPVKETALQAGIPVWQPEKVRDSAFVRFTGFRQKRVWRFSPWPL